MKSLATIVPCEIAWEITMTTTALIALIVAIAFYIALSTANKRFRAKLEQQKAALEKQHEKETEDMKRNVLTSVSQALLTPMTMVISPLQQMASDPLPEDARMKIQETLTKIINEGSGGLICIIL